MAGSGHMTKKGWNVPAEGPETNTEVLRNVKARKNSKSELVQNRLSDGAIDNAYDNYVKTKLYAFLQRRFSSLTSNLWNKLEVIVVLGEF